MTITAAQIRAARGLLNWSQSALADAAKLSRPTIDRAERASVSDEARATIRSTLEAAGVIFVAENGEGPGVRLRKEK
ncbi:helix-turn-helix domain-containing protein [Xanthobacter aminoxidans]|uniref:helix-turn-helix domain-containing protein n=1 Tax=Xanthobacter aminoxidans TaxID=186280 RepID=UPI002022F271|nr:helix-turn-helix transcriptional regulator [Xanthobacter aminoxidans]MCL8385863.1 helix-turn-helix domain-containing protein [Xanthobacter aminoxidans]